MSDREMSHSVSRSRSRSHREHSRDRSESRERRNSVSKKYDRVHSPERNKSYNREKVPRLRYRSKSRSPQSKYKSKYSSRSRSRSRSYDRRRSDSRSPKRTNGKAELSDSQPRCLGVFGLSIFTTEQQITEIFSRFGPLERVQVIFDAKTGRSRGYCFVYFKNHEDAKLACEQCTGMELDDRRIRVDFSITQRAHTPTPGVYMGKPTKAYRNKDRYYDRDSRYRYKNDYDRDRDRQRYRRRSPSPHYRERRRRYDRSRSRSYSPRNRRYR